MTQDQNRYKPKNVSSFAIKFHRLHYHYINPINTYLPCNTLINYIFFVWFYPLELLLKKMGLKFGAGFAVATLLLVVLMMSVPTTARNVGGSGNWGFGFNYTNWAQRNSRIVVGGSQHWRFGFNYTNWAFQNGPFFQNDTLGKCYCPSMSYLLNGLGRVGC